MAMFEQTFEDHIKAELKLRREFDSVQSVFHPHVRVTSLVKGTYEGVTLNGFTLGIPDVNAIKTLDSYFNSSGQEGTAIGLTYRNGTEVVRIGSGRKKLPSPGVTDVNISTQSKGGFIFKGTINLKFYGKDQYNFIYQTFLRPGNPILIEYGHTQATDGRKDLGFFTDLNENIIQYKNNFRNNKTLRMKTANGQPSVNSGAVVGLVSNFSVLLNEQNEYEATIELINALEFLFTLSPEDTFLDYSEGGLSKSITGNFGVGEEGDWEPEYDLFFNMMLEEAYKNRRHQLAGQLDYGSGIILPGEWGKVGAMAKAGRAVASIWRSKEKEAGLEPLAMKFGRTTFDTEEDFMEFTISQADNVYVSLNYFLNKLLNDILNASYVEGQQYNPLNATLVSDAEGMTEDHAHQHVDKDMQSFTEERRYTYRAQAARRTVMLGPMEGSHTQELRSVDIKKVLINNATLYDELSMEHDYASGGGVNNPRAANFYKLRRVVYETKYEDDDVDNMFSIAPVFEPKEQYGKGTDEEPRSIINGIFVNYTIIRNAFLSAGSVAESIQRILNVVNRSTSGILDLRMKMIAAETDDKSGETFYRISVYDHTTAVQDIRFEGLYTFFEEHGKSEAIAYDFDFSLPNSIAAGVVASTFEPQEKQIVGGNPKEQMFIEYGYAQDAEGNVAIKSLLNESGDGHPPSDEVRLGVGDKQLTLAEMLTATLDNGEPDMPTRTRARSIKQDQADALAANKARATHRINSADWIGMFDPVYNPQFGKGGPGFIDEITGNAYHAMGVPARIKTVNEDTGEVTQIYYKKPGPVYDEDGQKIGDVEPLTPDYELSAAMAKENKKQADKDESQISLKGAEEEKLFRYILGYQEMMPSAMKAAAIGNGLYNIIPSSAKINIRIQGLDGFRFGDLFSVNNILPDPYDEDCIFMLTGYEHIINSEGWFTTIGATLWASKPRARELSAEVLALRPDPYA